MDLGTDTQAAVSANYDLMSVRANKATGSSNRTVKKRNVAYTEDSVAITIQNLYAAHLEEALTKGDKPPELYL